MIRNKKKYVALAMVYTLAGSSCLGSIGGVFDNKITVMANEMTAVQLASNETVSTWTICGYSEALFAEWEDSNAQNAKVYYRQAGSSQYIELTDKELIRQIDENTARVDILGLQAGEYDLKVESSSGIVYTKSDIAVTEYDRSGYAHFQYHNGIGAYQDNGALKDGAIVVYVTEENKDTITVPGYESYATGIGNILNGSGNSTPLFTALANDQKALVIRIIGNVTAPSGLTEYNGTGNGGTTGDNGNMAIIRNAKNITIEGVGADACINGWGFSFSVSSSDTNHESYEVRNLTFKNAPEDALGFQGVMSGDELTVPIERVWVHHNSFYSGYCENPAESDKAEGDGSCDFKRGRYLTLAYNYYEDCHKTNLFGASDSNLQFDITMHHNYYKDCASRMPLVRQANVHLYNNYFSGSTSKTVDARANAFVFSEANYYEDSKNPVYIDEKYTDTTVVKSYQDVFSNCTKENNATVVTDRSQTLSGSCTYANFDTNSSIFYYDSERKTTNVEHLTSAEAAKEECIAKSGVLKETGIIVENTGSDLTEDNTEATEVTSEAVTINTEEITEVTTKSTENTTQMVTEATEATTQATTKNTESSTQNTQGEEVQIVEAKGSMENASLIWKKSADTDAYNVYYKVAGANVAEYQQVDNALIRQYSDTYRVDIPGLAEGKYDIKVVPVTNQQLELEKAAMRTVQVEQHVREGFAFSKQSENGGIASGGYNNEDGTVPENAQILYVTKENINTIQLEVITNEKGTTTLCTGLADILKKREKGIDTTPLIIRMIGTIRSEDVTGLNSNGYLQVKGCINVTLEGIGEDATLYGFGVLVRNCLNVEVRNLGFMKFTDDALSLDTNNRNIWVHNNDFFYGSAGSDSDQAKGDGSCDIKGKSTYVTIAYNHFYDSGKSSLCGMSDTEEFFVSYHHNWFDHSDSRHPRIRVGTVHIYNNYFDGNAKYGVGVTKGSSAFVEKNVFRNCKYPMMSSMQGTDIATGDGTFSSEDGGMIKAYDNQISGESAIVYAQDDATQFDAYKASSREEQVPDTYKTVQGGTIYNNFDTSDSMYAYTPTEVSDVAQEVMAKAGRISGGDFKWEFDDAIDDSDYGINQELMDAINAYQTTMVLVGGNSVEIQYPADAKDEPTTTEATTELAEETTQITESTTKSTEVATNTTEETTKTTETATNVTEEMTKTTEEVTNTTEEKTETTTQATTENTNVELGEMRNITTMELVRDMGLGINLGNTFESCGDWIAQWGDGTVKSYETAWGSPVITEDMIKGYKQEGFGALRIPVAWSNMMGEDYTINSDYIQRVKQVVEWALEHDLYVIMNIHYDNGWFSGFSTDKDTCMYRYTRMWTQLAGEFQNYGDKLVFESLNEEGCWDDIWNHYSGDTTGKEEAYNLLNEINQKFVDIVRSSGGNNQKRHLLIAGYATDISLTCDALYQMPEDRQNRCAVSVHYYTPSTFTILEEDASWGTMRTTWGTDEDFEELEKLMDMMKENFVDKGVPVIVGEYGCTKTNKDENSVRLFLSSVCKAIYERQMCPVLWDTTGTHYDRTSCTLIDQQLKENLADVLESEEVEATTEETTQNRATTELEITTETEATTQRGEITESKITTETTTEIEVETRTEEPTTENETTIRTEEITRTEATTETGKTTRTETTTKTEETTRTEATTKVEGTTRTEAVTKTEETTRTETATKTEETTRTEATTKTEEATRTEAVTKTEEATRTEATTKVEGTTRTEATTKAEGTTRTEATTKTEAVTRTEETTKTEAATRTEETTRTEATTKAEGTTRTEAATGTEETTKTEATTKVEGTTRTEATTRTEEATRTEAVTKTEEATRTETTTKTEEATRTEATTKTEEATRTEAVTKTEEVTRTEEVTKTEETTEQIIVVESVTLNKASLSLTAGESQTLSATVSPSDATNQKLIWSSTDEKVAKVDSNGKVTAVAKGAATVIVQTEDGSKTAFCTVSVKEKQTTIDVTGISINPSTITLGLKKTKTLKVAITPSNATNKTVTYTSSNATVATVSSTGTVKAVAPGVATITVKAGSITKKVTVKVKPAKVTSFKKTKLSKTKIKISWKKQSKVTGYKVYRYNTKTKTYKLYKITRKNYVSIANLKKNTIYKFKVKAYKRSGSTVVNGDVSKIYTIKMK